MTKARDLQVLINCQKRQFIYHKKQLDELHESITQNMAKLDKLEKKDCNAE